MSRGTEGYIQQEVSIFHEATARYLNAQNILSHLFREFIMGQIETSLSYSRAQKYELVLVPTSNAHF